ELDEADSVSLGIEPEMIQRQHREDPVASTDTAHAESLASKRIRRLDIAPGHEVTGHARSIQGHHDLQISSVRHRRHRRRAADAAEWGAVPDPTRDVTLNQNDLRLDALLHEEPLLVGDPERQESRAQDEIGNDRDLRLRDAILDTREKPQKANENNGEANRTP